MKRTTSEYPSKQDDPNKSRQNLDPIKVNSQSHHQKDVFYSRTHTLSKDSEKEEESHGRHGRKVNFSKDATSVLKRWLIENVEHPYLKAVDKINLSRESGLSRK